MDSENGRYLGLLVDYGGVLTSDPFDSFRSFCPFNLAPAAELGMATVHHVSSAQTIDQLERLLEVGLR
jgi:hypothetical protein